MYLEGLLRISNRIKKMDKYIKAIIEGLLVCATGRSDAFSLIHSSTCKVDVTLLTPHVDDNSERWSNLATV